MNDVNADPDSYQDACRAHAITNVRRRQDRRPDVFFVQVPRV